MQFREQARSTGDHWILTWVPHRVQQDDSGRIDWLSAVEQIKQSSGLVEDKDFAATLAASDVATTTWQVQQPPARLPNVWRGAQIDGHRSS